MLQPCAQMHDDSRGKSDRHRGSESAAVVKANRTNEAEE
jgi:hypothetical protein